MKQQKRSYPLLPVIFLAILAIALVWVATLRWGLGLVGRDVVAYIQAGSSLAFGNGLFIIGSDGTWQAMNGVPPLYPMLLSWGPFLGMDIEAWARMLNAFFFGVVVFSSGAMAWVVSRHMRFASITAGIVLASVSLTTTFMNMGGEPFFMALMALSFLFLILSQEEDVVAKGRFLYLSAVAAGIGTLVSYTGIVLLGAEAVFLMLFSIGERRERVKRTGLFLLFGLLLPVIVYAVRYAALGSGMDVFTGFSMPTLKGITLFLNGISQWFFPGRFPWILRMVLTLGLFWVLIRSALKIKRDTSLGKNEFHLVALLVSFLVFYVLFVVTVLMFLGHGLLNSHILMPACWAFSILAAVVLGRTVTPVVRTRFSVGMVVLSLLITLGSMRTFQLVRSHFRHGAGYSGKGWQGSLLAEQVKTLSDKVTVYTDDPDGFYALTKRASIRVPLKNENAPWLKGAESFRALKERKAFIILFHGIPADQHPLWASVLKGSGADILFRDGEGVILGVVKPAKL